MDPKTIRSLRLRLEETQTDFGRRFSVSQITIAHWESGRSKPRETRLLDLFNLASDSKHLQRDLKPFRPIQYLGSKQRLATTILSIVKNNSDENDRVGDLFAGSGVVSHVLASSRPVSSVDIQSYSGVLCKALLLIKANDVYSTFNNNFYRRVDAVENAIQELARPVLLLEQEAIRAAKRGQPQSLIDLIDYGSIAANEQRQTQKCPKYLRTALNGTAHAFAESRFTESNLTATRYFGGSYFSFAQAIALDAIHIAAQELTPEARQFALAVLLSTASNIVNTVGKQFAQPMRLQKADGSVPPLLLERTLRDRSIDTKSTFADWADKWQLNLDAGDRKHRVVTEDAVGFVTKDRSCSIYYADPPYTIDHYSRFYHVLETLSKRDQPRLDEMKKRGESEVMRGIYRNGRYQSPFCIPSEAPNAFAKLFSGIAANGARLVLSYSPYNEQEDHRSRLLTLEQLLSLARKCFSVVEVVDVFDHSHRKLNAKAVNVTVRADAERIILCK